MKERFNRLAPTEAVEQTQTDTFRFVFSNEKVGRDGFVVLNSAIKHANFDKNPVILWAHDDKQPPIGRGTNIDTSQVNCTFDLTFVPRDILPFAGVIRDLVAGKWMRAVSLSWQPIEVKRSSDPDIVAIFTAVDVLEISLVPLPALPDALETARSHGVNTRPLAEWAERAIETRSYRAVPRPELERIFRAAQPRLQTRSDRRRRAEEIQARGRRAQIAARILDRVRKDDDDALRAQQPDAVRRGESR